MGVALDWLGCATYRLTVDGLVVFLDAYMDRPAPAPPVGLTSREVQRADYVLVGHSHFDHLWGAENIAANTGATIVGSYESIRVMHDQEEIPEQQLLPVSGGERLQLNDAVSVRVYPSLHSCIWSRTGRVDEVCIGDYGVPHQERMERLGARAGRRGTGNAPAVPWANQRPRGDGGPLVYLVDTPYGSIFWQDSMGHFTGVMRDIRPDVALIAAAGRGNIDGEPIQGSAAQFVAREVELMNPKRVLLNHYDDFAGRGAYFTDIGPVADEIAMRAPRTDVVEVGFMGGDDVLAGLR